jgi:dynein heavy chain
MKASMQSVIAQSHLDYAKYKDKRANWIKNWQGQVVLAVSQIYWTANIEQALATN